MSANRAITAGRGALARTFPGIAVQQWSTATQVRWEGHARTCADWPAARIGDIEGLPVATDQPLIPLRAAVRACKSAATGPARVGIRLFTGQMVAVVLYSSRVQQLVRATAVLDRRPHMPWAAPGDRKQGRASSLQPGGQAEATAEPSNQVSNNARRQQRTPVDTDGRWLPAQACRRAGRGRCDLASGRRGRRFKSGHPDPAHIHRHVDLSVTEYPVAVSAGAATLTRGG
jgi:hypothetical protein